MTDYVLCINRGSNPASLVFSKVYRRLPDPQAESRKLIRVVDEDTAEPDGYLYPASLFVPVELPEAAIRALQKASD